MSSVIHGSTLLRGLAALSLAGIGTGCADGQPKAGLGPNEEAVTSISLVSAASTIDAGQVVVVKAAGRTGAGQPASVAVDWSASGGSIVPVSDSEAQFSAGAAGSYTVVAQGTTAPFPVDSTRFTVVQPVSPTVALSVTPASVALPTGGIRVFTATATRQDGSTYLPSVTWSATGGSVSGAGVYTAGSSPGSFVVVASQGGGALVDTAIVTINAPVLQALTLNPAAVSLVIGGTLQFSVTGQWSDGSTTPPAVSYSATGGTITAGGYFVAGSTPGIYRVIATVQGGMLADTSSVLLEVPGVNPHEPAGMASAFDEAWNTTPNGRTGPLEWITDGPGANFSIVTDATAPASPSNVLQVLYPQGFGGGFSPAQAYFAYSGGLPSNTGTLYMRMRIKVSSNWTDNGNSGTKLVFVRPWAGEGGGSGAQTNHVIMLTDHGALDFGFTTQESSDREYRTGGNFAKGVWHDLEYLLTLGTSGSANDGTAKAWVDGVQVLNVTGIKMLFNGQSAAAGWRYLFLDPTYGGGYNAPPANLNFQIDHWYASVK